MYHIKKDSTEGIDYVNVHPKGAVRLGKLLSPGRALRAPIVTILGRVGNLRSALDFINTPSYPANLLIKTKLRKNDIDYINRLKSVKIKEYWAIASMVIIERVFADKEIIKLLGNLAKKTKLTAYNVIDLDGGTSLVKQNSLIQYIRVLELIRENLTVLTKEEMLIEIPAILASDDCVDYFEDTHFLVK